MEIIAIESGDETGWLESATTIGEVEFNSIQSFVDNVRNFLNGDRMHKLHLQAHGNTTEIEFGSDTLDLDSFTLLYRGTFALLTPCFTSNAIVVLRACEVGQNVALLTTLARVWNVTIIAGRGAQNNLLNFNTGRYVIISPDGSIDTSIFLPAQADYQNTGRDERIGQMVKNLFR